MLLLDFVVALMFMKNIAYKTKSLVIQLQTMELNVLDATGLVEATLSIMEKIRADDKMMDDQIESSIIFARSLGIDPEDDFNRYHRPRRVPRCLAQNKKSLFPLLKCLKPPIDATSNRCNMHSFCCLAIPTITDA
jgi:hypothetical protein